MKERGVNSDVHTQKNGESDNSTCSNAHRLCHTGDGDDALFLLSSQSRALSDKALTKLPVLHTDFLSKM